MGQFRYVGLTVAVVAQVKQGFIDWNDQTAEDIYEKEEEGANQFKNCHVCCESMLKLQ